MRVFAALVSVSQYCTGTSLFDDHGYELSVVNFLSQPWLYSICIAIHTSVILSLWFYEGLSGRYQGVLSDVDWLSLGSTAKRKAWVSG